MNALAEPIEPATRVVPFTDAVELNPRLDRAALPDDLEVSFVPMAAVEAGSGRMDATAIRPFGEVKKGYTAFREGDVLFAKITPCMENGKMAVARGLRNGIGCGSTEFHVLRPRPGVDAHYVYHFVSSARFRAEAAHNMTGAVGQKRVPAAFLEQRQIPLPDLDKQRRIVAEIEKQFSRLDEAVANLKRVKANLKRYKAAVLTAAVEGRLAPAEAEVASREGREFEDGEQLLQRILEARQQRWQRKGKYKKPADVASGSRHSVPVGWTVATVDQLAQKVTDGTHHTPTYLPTGVPFISVKDVHDGTVSFAEAKFISHDEHAELSKRCNPEQGDVLITKSGTIGRTATVETDRAFSLFVSVALVKPVRPQVSPWYLQIALDAYIQSINVSQDVKGGLLKNLHLEDLRVVALPLPPAAEQVRIVVEVDRRLSIVREIEAEVDANLRRAQALRQAVLSSSFQAPSEGGA